MSTSPHRLKKKIKKKTIRVIVKKYVRIVKIRVTRGGFGVLYNGSFVACWKISLVVVHAMVTTQKPNNNEPRNVLSMYIFICIHTHKIAQCVYSYTFAT